MGEEARYLRAVLSVLVVRCSQNIESTEVVVGSASASALAIVPRLVSVSGVQLSTWALVERAFYEV